MGSSTRPLAQGTLLNEPTMQPKTANLSKEQLPLPKQDKRPEQKEQPPLPKQDGRLKQNVGSSVRLKSLTGYLSSLNGKTGLLEDFDVGTLACFVRLPDGCME